jgi:hypothetical protein
MSWRTTKVGESSQGSSHTHGAFLVIYITYGDLLDTSAPADSSKSRRPGLDDRDPTSASLATRALAPARGDVVVHSRAGLVSPRGKPHVESNRLVLPPNCARSGAGRNAERWRIVEGPRKSVLTGAQKTLAKKREELAAFQDRLRLRHGIARELRKQQSILEREIVELEREALEGGTG